MPKSIATQLLSHTPLLHARIMQACNIDNAQIIPLFTEVLKYLEINAKSSDKRTPSIIVDNAWHEFILFTKLYATHCQQHYGKFIHHRPGGSTQENQQQYIQTINDIELTFGTLNEAYWHRPTYLCPDAQCGSCD